MKVQSVQIGLLRAEASRYLHLHEGILGRAERSDVVQLDPRAALRFDRIPEGPLRTVFGQVEIDLRCKRARTTARQCLDEAGRLNVARR